MTQEQFDKRLKKRENIFIGFMFLTLLATGYLGYYLAQLMFEPASNILTNWLLYNVPSIFILMSLFMYGIAQPVNFMMERTWLKRYWIEDCGHVVKVHGSIPCSGWENVYAKLLAVKPEYKVIDGAYEKYGCTLAAVPATPEDLQAKTELALLGIKVPSLG